MHNERSGARAHRKRRDEEVLSAQEVRAQNRGQLLKRYVRAAAALRGMYDDKAIAAAVGRGRGAVGAWWTGSRMEPDTIMRLADVLGLSFEELSRFVYGDGPPPRLPASGPAGLQEGVRRAQGRLDDEDPGTPAR